ncbi:MAG: methyl-accepting chemotaxis protein [bacterium]
MDIFLNRFKLSHKLIIMGVSFSVPIAILLYFMITGYNKSINSTQKEIKGNIIITSIVKLIPLISEHSKITNDLIWSNNKSIVHVEMIDREIDASFNKLKNDITLYGESVGLDNETLSNENNQKFIYSDLLTRWQNLRKNWIDFSNKKNTTNHIIMYNLLIEYLKLVGDKSELILDPDLDSYYLMITSVDVFPNLVSHLNIAILYNEDLVNPQINSLAKIERLKVYKSLISEKAFDYALKNISKSLSEDEKFYGKSNTLQINLNKILPEFELVINNFNNLLDLIIENKEPFDTEKYGILSSEALNKTVVLWQKVNLELNNLLVERKKSHSQNRLAALILSLTALSLSLGSVMFLIKSITQPLSKVTEIAKKIKEGKIYDAINDINKSNIKINNTSNKDEILLLFGTISAMTTSLGSVLTQVQKSENLVSTSAFKITNSVRQLESAAVEQAASTTQVSATSKQISSASNELTGVMNDVVAMVKESTDLTDQGLQNFLEIKNVSNLLLSSSSNISEKLALLNEKSAKVSSIIVTITKVADKINLLSLNAALEAEKAGKTGAGFSVVANEMKRLADQTAVGALNIEEIIFEMQDAVEAGVIAIENYSLHIKENTVKIAQLSDSFAKVFAKINEIGPNFNIVNDGMIQQSTSAEFISQAMIQLNSTATAIKNELIQFNNITNGLNESVKILKKEVSNFSIN